MKNKVRLSLRVPEPKQRPGDTPDFSSLLGFPTPVPCAARTST